jgi:Bacterial capsule synthesis protein PGA_cap
VSVRTPGYRPRRSSSPRWPLGILIVVGLLAVVALPLAGLGVLSGEGSPVPTSSQVALAPSGSAGASAPPSSPASPAPPTGTPTAPPSPTAPVVRTAIVPVTHFRSPVANSSFKDVEAVLDGTSGRYDALELVASEADAILAALGMERPQDAARLVLAPDLATLEADLTETRKRLAFVRADAVGPNLRALGWGRDALFGVGKVASLDAWPLFADLPETTAAEGAPPPYDPAASWTLVAGGDILLDRGVYQTVVINGRGVDFPFDGGTAEITSRYCCSSFGWELPRTRRTGNEGAVRRILEGADLAIANFENPAPDNPRFHTSGTVFTADPDLIDGLVDAGLDWVSLANNHIRDAGGRGILETIANLEERGLAHGGAGENLAAAHTPSILEARGTTVGIVAYDTIAKGYGAGSERIGSAQASLKACREDVKKARDAGADVVIIFPHWGTEYDATPFSGQQRLARACLDAGADLIIGNHAHWAGAVEVYKDKPIFYALGNFVFDQTWSEPTMEGMTLELTFTGAELRQVKMRPHIILDKAQPNFLDPSGDGRVVLGQVFQASEGLLPW